MRRCDTSNAGGEETVSFLKYAVGANYGRFWKQLRSAAARDGRNPFLLAADFLVCVPRYGCGLTDYLSYRFWNKSAGERREYVTIRDSEEFYKKVSPDRYKDFFSIKTNFMTNFAAYTGREFFAPAEDNADGLGRFLRGRDAVMVKPVNGLAGRDVRKQPTAAIADAAAFHRELLDNGLFVEEVIVQHPELAALCPASVNTIRVMTAAAGGRSELLFACLRVGAGADVDNFHVGGMAVHVNTETGALEGCAVNKSGEEFACHPVTGLEFDGRVLPMWDEVRRVCLEAALVNPNIHVVGWDVAITPDGPVFVEGNRRPGFDLPQMTTHRGRKDLIRRTEELLARAEPKH